MTIENIPNTNYLPYANFCFKKKDNIEPVPYGSIVIWCNKLFTGRYLLFHQKFFPDDNNVMSIQELYIYGKKAKVNEITGLFFLHLLI